MFNADLSSCKIVKCNVLRITLIAQFVLYSMHRSASTVKWIADPWLVLCEGDLKLHIHFEICEGKFHRYFKKYVLQSQANYVDKNNSEKCLHI